MHPDNAPDSTQKPAFPWTGFFIGFPYELFHSLRWEGQEGAARSLAEAVLPVAQRVIQHLLGLAAAATGRPALNLPVREKETTRRFRTSWGSDHLRRTEKKKSRQKRDQSKSCRSGSVQHGSYRRASTPVTAYVLASMF
jgi:epoxyqueuosine reductase QueG